MTNFLKENWFRLALIISILILSGVLFYEPTSKSQVPLNDEDEILTSENKEVLIKDDIEIEFRRECFTEYQEISESIDKFAKTDLDFAISYGQIAGVLDENRYVIGDDIWVKNCVAEKIDSY